MKVFEKFFMNFNCLFISVYYGFSFIYMREEKFLNNEWNESF